MPLALAITGHQGTGQHWAVCRFFHYFSIIYRSTAVTPQKIPLFLRSLINTLKAAHHRAATEILLRADYDPSKHNGYKTSSVNINVARAYHDGLWHNLPRREQMIRHPELLIRMTSPVLPALGSVVFTPLALLLLGPILLTGELPGKRTFKKFRLRKVGNDRSVDSAWCGQFYKIFTELPSVFAANTHKYPLNQQSPASHLSSAVAVLVHSLQEYPRKKALAATKEMGKTEVTRLLPPLQVHHSQYLKHSHSRHRHPP